LTISFNLYVRSSSDRDAASIMTDGRTGGGGTGKAVRIIQSGRQRDGSKPSARQSPSDTRRRMSCALAAVSSWRRSTSGTPTPSPSAPGRALGNSAHTFGPSTRYCGCGDPVASSAFFPAHAARNARRRACGLRTRAAALNRGSSGESRMADVWKETHRRTLTTVVMKPMW